MADFYARPWPGAYHRAHRWRFAGHGTCYRTRTRCPAHGNPCWLAIRCRSCPGLYMGCGFRSAPTVRFWELHLSHPPAKSGGSTGHRACRLFYLQRRQPATMPQTQPEISVSISKLIHAFFDLLAQFVHRHRITGAAVITGYNVEIFERQPIGVFVFFHQF